MSISPEVQAILVSFATMVWAVVGGQVIAYVHGLVAKIRQEWLRKLIEALVEAAEQQWDPNQQAAKKAAVLATLKTQGVKITPAIDAQVEAAVYRLKQAKTGCD